MTSLTERDLSRNRLAYIIEAALEYFISLMVTDAFLATLLVKAGVSDDQAGIITQLASLALAAQLVSVFFRKRRGMKLWVTVLHLVNQLMYVSLYWISVFDISSGTKVVIFIVMFLGGHIVANIVQPYKLSWLNSFVPANGRGRFTANKEIVSLLGGMTFSFLMGTMVDHFKAVGNERLGFLLSGITVLVLAILHLGSLLLIKDHDEAEQSVPEHVSFRQAFRSTVTNKTMQKIVLVDIIWHFATGMSISFYGVYKINDLGFTLQFVSILSILSSLSRVAVSRFCGRIADKYSWTKLLTVCFGVAAIAFGLNIFTVPANGKILFAIYSCIYAMSMAGINGGLMNIIFDFVPPEEHAGALGIKYTFGGLAGFIAALIGSRILASIQGAGNQLFSLPVYGQQVLSGISCLLALILVLYMKTVIAKIKK